MMEFTYGEVCAGAGGIGLGLDSAGMSPRWAIEIDPACRRVIKRQWPELDIFSDVKETPSNVLGPVDLIAGGTPCTDLSVAGRREGLDGEHSRLFFEFTRIVTDIAPDWILWENVPGVLSSNEGRDFADVLGHLTGYFPEVPAEGWANSGTCTGGAYSVAWRVLDAQYFGVAQRRRRVFIVGHLGDGRAAEILFESESVFGDSAPSREARQIAAALTANGVGTCGPDDNQAQANHLIPLGFAWQTGGNNDPGTASLENLSPTLTANQTMAVAENQRGEIVTSDIAQSLSAGGGKPGQGYPAVMTVAVRGRDDGAQIEVGDDIANTLRTPGGGSSQAAIFDEVAVRRLTPTECEALMGWPKDHTAGESDTARYRMCGNGVVAPVSEWIGRRIMEQAS